MIDKDKCKKQVREKKSVILNIRVTPQISKDLKEQELSPTAIFYESLKDIKII
jgi:hypothetical protein